MQILDQFHDGYFDGVRTKGRLGGRVDLYLRTANNEQFTATIDGVVALNVSGFRAGNIIFDVSIFGHDEVTPEHIENLYELPNGDAGLKMQSKLLEKVRTEELMVLQIDSSYGATCVILGRTINLVKDAPTLSPKDGEKDKAPKLGARNIRTDN